MRGENQARSRPHRLGQCFTCDADVTGVGLDETLVGMPVGHVCDVDVGQAGADDLGARVDYVLPVLRAARIRAVRRADETDRAPDAIVRHRPQRVGRSGCQLRMPR